MALLGYPADLEQRASSGNPFDSHAGFLPAASGVYLRQRAGTGNHNTGNPFHGNAVRIRRIGSSRFSAQRNQWGWCLSAYRLGAAVTKRCNTKEWNRNLVGRAVRADCGMPTGNPLLSDGSRGYPEVENQINTTTLWRKRYQ